MITICVLIYLVSFALHLVVCYKEYKCAIHKVGDLIDLIEFHMWFPLLNTLLVLVIIIGVIIMKLCEVSKLNILWEKFRNIKIRQLWHK